MKVIVMGAIAATVMALEVREEKLVHERKSCQTDSDCPKGHSKCTSVTSDAPGHCTDDNCSMM